MPSSPSALLAAAVGAAFAVSITAPPASAVTRTAVFSSTGAEQQFVVPADVTSLSVVATGGRGSAAVSSGAHGGVGARVSATLVVTPGEVLFVEVGGNGGGGAFGDTRPGGFNGGGTGGAAEFADYGGGGGGASDLRLVPAAQVATTLDSRLVTAAGGGGGGAEYAGADGNAPGTGNGVTGGGAGGGGGGTLVGPGAGGVGGFDGNDGGAGALGKGGTGGGGLESHGGGGGGGAGIVGGGGGGGGSPGGGGGSGSSGVGVGATLLSVTSSPAGSDASVVLSYTLTDPETTIDKAPHKKVRTPKKKVKLTFGFSSTSVGATFECSLDGASYQPCTSPEKVKVKAGKHTFSVRAVLKGVVDQTPASARVKVKHVANHKPK